MAQNNVGIDGETQRDYGCHAAHALIGTPYALEGGHYPWDVLSEITVQRQHFGLSYCKHSSSLHPM